MISYSPEGSVSVIRCIDSSVKYDLDRDCDSSKFIAVYIAAGNARILETDFEHGDIYFDTRFCQKQCFKQKNDNLAKVQKWQQIEIDCNETDSLILDDINRNVVGLESYLNVGNKSSVSSSGIPTAIALVDESYSNFSYSNMVDNNISVGNNVSLDIYPGGTTYFYIVVTVKTSCDKRLSNYQWQLMLFN